MIAAPVQTRVVYQPTARPAVSPYGSYAAMPSYRAAPATYGYAVAAPHAPVTAKTCGAMSFVPSAVPMTRSTLNVGAASSRSLLPPTVKTAAPARFVPPHAPPIPSGVASLHAPALSSAASVHAPATASLAHTARSPVLETRTTFPVRSAKAAPTPSFVAAPMSPEGHDPLSSTWASTWNASFQGLPKVNMACVTPRPPSFVPIPRAASFDDPSGLSSHLPGPPPKMPSSTTTDASTTATETFPRSPKSSPAKEETAQQVAIGRHSFSLTEIIGRGAFGVVWRSPEKSNSAGLETAVKVVGAKDAPGLSAACFEAELLQRF
ncbi:unnamed protein product [Effrenium voratum]|uniref:Protein kinase domain-containing protein n=1 Tax=Effrenium voratum TaxID=2562239 RepID=A0AA36J7B7_9DINO|nr:unnamed protein product [Effrenium voratum]CAJ1421594.1 unnamed protein product [Effrenium voratum]